VLPYTHMTEQAKKSLGQHWLRDDTSLDMMVRSAGVQAGDTVLEIGPGTGLLTDKLVQAGVRIVAIELDRDLIASLEQRFSGDDVAIYHADILSFDLTQLPPDYLVVANIPYYLTSNLLRVLSESSNPPKRCALLVQREVAERVVAEPGDMSLLSVATQFYWQSSLGAVVPAQLFDPPPKVDSQILILKQRAQPLYDVDTRQFFRVVKAGFAARRKKLRGSLAAGLRISKPAAEQLLRAAGVSPDVRPQELSLEQWRDVYELAVQQNVLA
jgi:16S rRNA (adenine1518-N6/adenine1519-N6)-dimethyltransferase